jgi:hypothetical protein
LTMMGPPRRARNGLGPRHRISLHDSQIHAPSIRPGRTSSPRTRDSCRLPGSSEHPARDTSETATPRNVIRQKQNRYTVFLNASAGYRSPWLRNESEVVPR